MVDCVVGSALNLVAGLGVLVHLVADGVLDGVHCGWFVAVKLNLKVGDSALVCKCC